LSPRFSVTSTAATRSAAPARIAAVFGIDAASWSLNIKDIYSFTETPAMIVIQS